VGCGACLGVCPKDAILPKVFAGYISVSIDVNKCARCQLCYEVCPVPTNLNSKDKSIQAFTSRMFIGYAADEKIRYQGASGGVITAILSYLLEKGEVNGVLVAKICGKNILPYIATNPGQLAESQGSIYFPTFSLKLLKELKHKEGKYAVVGLPCQIDALIRIIAEGFLAANKIKYLLGLRCYHVNAPWYLTYMIKHMLRLPVDKVNEVSARKYGWPGKVIVKSKMGTYIIPHFYNRKSGIGLWNPLALGDFNAQLGCLLCTNHENTNADITFGDAWFSQIMRKDKIGTSLIIVRTEKGRKLIEKVVSEGRIVIRNIKEENYPHQSLTDVRIIRILVLRTMIKKGFVKTLRRWGLACLLTTIPYFVISSPSLRRVLLHIMPPKILMEVISAYMQMLKWYLAHTLTNGKAKIAMVR